MRMMRWNWVLRLALLPIAVTSGAAAPEWDTFSDTWVATDSLGRKLPTHVEAGKPRAGRTVGIFYFLWLGGHSRELYDLTTILAADPVNPKYGPPGAFHFWGQPLHGYYYSDDEWVIRKHAQMLADAGVDVVIFDVTNGFTYDETYRKLCRVYASMRTAGLRTPQIAFIAHSGEGKVVQRLYDTFYQPGLHDDLWFRWRGKPLVLAAPGALAPALREFFTVRESWAWTKGHPWFADGKDKWPWLDNHPQNAGWHESPDRPEQLSVSVAQHPTSNIGRSFHRGRQPASGTTQTEKGLCFAEQWERALTVDPQFVFITGWNEWVAQRFISEKGGQPFLGKPLPPGGTFFVDQYSQEYSRDIEPMRGGHGDNYYYQMTGYIRRYKGARPLASISATTCKIDGNFSEWALVKPEFRDTVHDPVQRDHPGWKGAGHYKNETRRNDLRLAKAAHDADRIYFYVQSTDSLTDSKHPNWMLLFIDADQDACTGWLGYDFVLNRTRSGESQASLERHAGQGYQWAPAGHVSFAYGGRELELAVPRELLVKPSSTGVDFKWADNIAGDGEWSDFTLNGDTAPNDRFNYRAVLTSSNPERR